MKWNRVRGGTPPKPRGNARGKVPKASRSPWPKEAISHVEMGQLDSQRQKCRQSQQTAGQQSAFMAASSRPAQGTRQ